MKYAVTWPLCFICSHVRRRCTVVVCTSQSHAQTDTSLETFRIYGTLSNVSFSAIPERLNRRINPSRQSNRVRYDANQLYILQGVLIQITPRRAATCPHQPYALWVSGRKLRTRRAINCEVLIYRESGGYFSTECARASLGQKVVRIIRHINATCELFSRRLFSLVLFNFFKVFYCIKTQFPTHTYI